MPSRKLLLIAIALLASGCSGGDEPSVAATSAPLPTATASPTSTAAPTPTTASPTPPPRATRGPAIDGDVDGDGTADSIRTSSTTLTVELSGEDITVTAPVHAEDPGQPALLGSGDVDRDGFSEVFLETARGASTTFATPYRYDGKVLRELQLEGGPARLGIGGGVLHGDGFRCLPNGRLEVRSADSQDGETFTVHVLTYRLTATELVLVSTTTSQARQGDPAVELSYVVSCGTVGDGS